AGVSRRLELSKRTGEAGTNRFPGAAGCHPVASVLTAGPQKEKRYNLRRRPRTAGPADEGTSHTPPARSVPVRRRDPPLRVPGPSVNPSPQLAPLNTDGHNSGATTSAKDYNCPECDRSFRSKIGLGVHRRHAHPDEASAGVEVERKRKQWSAEELRLMAKEEALAIARGGIRFMNQHLMAVLPNNRSLEAVKGARRAAAYKELVEAALRETRTASDSADSDSSFHSAHEEPLEDLPSRDITGSSPFLQPTRHLPSPAMQPPDIFCQDFRSAISDLLPIVECIQGFETLSLVGIARNYLQGFENAHELGGWLRAVFPPRPLILPRLPCRHNSIRLSRKRQRRLDYAHVQRLFKTNMSRAATEILDGPIEAHAPDVATMAAYWGPFVTTESGQVPKKKRKSPDASLGYVWHPVTEVEARKVAISISSAPGIDGVTARQWRAVPASVKTLFFNIILATGGFPPDMLVSRTVFVAKKPGATQPSDFRPISIASVVVRHLHKILALRLREGALVQTWQRCLEDGCAENISVVASLLDDSRRCLKELHILSLDVASAFDAVSHHAITNALIRTGLPEGFVRYVDRLYARSSTKFEVRGVHSESFKVCRGVRQGDPLSSLLFCLVVDEVLRAVPSDVGYEIGDGRVNTLAYADDILLIASTKNGLDVSLQAVEARAKEQGLLFNPRKCVCLSIVPSGKQKKYKVLAAPQCSLADGSQVHQLTPSEQWRYLGVDFRPVGPKRAGGTINTELDRLTKAPLKPQQRLKILRCFLIPRYYHTLVLAGTTLGKLKALDRQVRTAIRRWLRLPPDATNAYFHTPCRMGGLGIPSFSTTIPGLMLTRLKKLANSTSPAVRAAAQSAWVEMRLKWAERGLTKDGNVLSTPDARDRWWAQQLYRSVDGFELQESGKTGLSTRWIDAGSYGIPGRDYVQYHHIRINSLPTRIRTSRGIRRENRELRCRAGCHVTETAAHIIQACHRTHGGRIKRHNAICKVVAAGLRDAGWSVMVEPRIQTGEGLRKPDLVAHRDRQVEVIDAQIVSGATSLDDAHERKRRYYADNLDISRNVAQQADTIPSKVSFSTCTLSWRGVWSFRSAEDMIRLGLSSRLLSGITTRVLQGSHTNWMRWNKMTGLGAPEGRLRAGIG
ncbi:hypothetical protein KM043_000117, partial [Ampulex compressa]